MLSIADKHYFPPLNVMVWWYCKVHTKSLHPNWCIKVVSSPARLPCWWIILFFLSSDMIVSVGHVYIKIFTFLKKLWDPFLWMGFNCLKTTKLLQKKKFTFYHSVPRTSLHSFSWPRKDERVSWPQSHSAVLNLGPLNWESRTLTTRALLV